MLTQRAVSSPAATLGSTTLAPSGTMCCLAYSEPWWRYSLVLTAPRTMPRPTSSAPDTRPAARELENSLYSAYSLSTSSWVLNAVVSSASRLSNISLSASVTDSGMRRPTAPPSTSDFSRSGNM